MIPRSQLMKGNIIMDETLTASEKILATLLNAPTDDARRYHRRLIEARLPAECFMHKRQGPQGPVFVPDHLWEAVVRIDYLANFRDENPPLWTVRHGLLGDETDPERFLAGDRLFRNLEGHVCDSDEFERSIEEARAEYEAVAQREIQASITIAEVMQICLHWIKIGQATWELGQDGAMPPEQATRTVREVIARTARFQEILGAEHLHALECPPEEMRMDPPILDQLETVRSLTPADCVSAGCKMALPHF